jgi:hypothetical protein
VIDCGEGRRALEEAKRERKRVESRDAHVDWLSEQLWQAKQENHFSELILQAMRRKGHQ